MEKLKIGVVGVGYLGEFHAEKYSRMHDVHLVGVADINRQRADTIAKMFHTRSFTHYEDLIGKVDAVSIVVPTPYHYPVSKCFLENDIDVMIEKPMTTTLQEADDLIAVAEAKGHIIQVGHLERFNPAVVALKNYVNTPMFIESHRLSVFKPRGTDVDVVLDLMIHDIDIIMSLVNAKLNSIKAAGIPVVTEYGDIANARLEFANGCIANVTASRISMKNERKIRLFQKGAYLSVDFANREITIIRQNGKSTTGIIPGMDINQLNVTQGDALEAELKSFVHAVKHRMMPEVTGKMGREALKVALSIIEQNRQTRKQFLES